jgi:hypothetical protein
MDPEIARNQDYDDHNTNDSEDVHSALSPFHDDSVRRARSSYVSVAIKLIASFRHRWLGAAELATTSRFYRHRLYPQYPPSPKSRTSTRTMRMRSISSSKMSGGKTPACTCGCRNNYSPASDSTYYYFGEAVMRLRVYRSRPRPNTVASMTELMSIVGERSHG